MTPKQVVKHFGSQGKAAIALRITQPAVAHWFTRGAVPIGRQALIEKQTKGALKAAATQRKQKARAA